MLARRVAVINEKGGSTKTTLVSTIGSYLALHRGRRVLAIDMDPQGQLGKVLGVETRSRRRSAIDLLLDSVLGDASSLEYSYEDAADPALRPASTLPISTTRIPQLDVITANKSLGLFPILEDDEADPTGRLSRALDSAPELEAYDFILFDAPPSFGPLTLNILRAATEIVVPVPLTYLAMDGCAEIVRTIATVRSRYDHPDLHIAMIVPTLYRRTKLANEILERLKQRFPKEIAHTVVGYHVKIDEAQSRGLSIFEYAPKDRAASVMAELAEELELRGKPGHDGSPA
ncbi:MAG: ParA family protein [Myxococcales bacterium]|nr:ParA family protein [Myxococcales bacterium]